MELKVTDKIENKSLGRTEITCEVEFEKAVPSRKEIREAVCAALSLAPELIVVVSVNGSFGTHRATVLLRAYKTKEAALAEHNYLLVRDSLAEKKKKKPKAKAPAKK